MTEENVHISPEFCEAVANGQALGEVSMLAFRDPNAFMAGNLHGCHPVWERIAEAHPYDLSSKVLKWIKNCVDVHDFFQPFKGKFKGECFDSTLPPQKYFPNSISCKPFAQFVSDTISSRLATGAISLVDKVGQVDPPHLVMPLTVEPSKPRLCNDNRFLNLWINDSPFTLDPLAALPRYVSRDSFQTVCDDKSGYDHVFLTPASRTYFGFQWAGWYFTSNSIPFGWKSSAYVYHSIGLLASHYFRSLLIPCSLYIDDRHTGEIQLSGEIQFFLFAIPSLLWGTFKKSYLIPQHVVPYLGFLVDSVHQAFLLIEDKKLKFLSAAPRSEF